MLTAVKTGAEMESDCSSSESSDSSTSMDNILESGHKTTTYKQLGKCCRPTYKIRKLKNKGALLVLVWNFLMMSQFYYMYDSARGIHVKQNYIIVGIILPIAGWLADVYLGRYKMIRWSILITWIGSMLDTIRSLVEQLVDDYEAISERRIIECSLQVIAAVGFGGYQANIIQFGIDQLHDASTEEIQAFISWYAWSYVSGGMIMEIAASCIPEDYNFIRPLLTAVSLTIVLTLSFTLDKTLVKEPVNQNPFKLVYKVIKFAIKNKHPRCRSAFTYCEDELPSRLDLGKSKYGGPFTTEQVEDVKTFLRLMMIVFFGCAVQSAVLVANEVRDQLAKALTNNGQINTPSLQCYLHTMYTKAPYFSVLLLVPVHEFITRPILHRYFTWIQCYRLFSFGAILQFIRLMLLMAYILIARHNFIAQHHGHNVTIHCIFRTEDHGALTSSFDIRWMVLQGSLNSLSMFMIGLGGVEFICAQTPYSMRGLISGAGYGSVALLTLAGLAITRPFVMDLPIWNNGGIISCGFWYLLLVIIFFICNGIILFILGRVYKNRKREDVLPNEHIFAERYYSKQY